MVQLSLTVWVHVAHVSALIRDWRWVQYAGHVFTLELQLCRRGPVGRLLPVQLQRAAHACHPEAMHYQYHPSQITGLWITGVLDSRYPKYDDALKCSGGSGHSAMWIDDTYLPAEEDRWEDICEKYLQS